MVTADPGTDQVLELVRVAEQADGFGALNEAALLRLRHAAPDTRHVTRTDGGDLLAYGQLTGPAQTPAEAALVVHPAHRRRGLGTDVLGELLRLSSELEIWAVQASDAAAALAAKAGLTAVRELLIMSRPLDEAVEPVDPPPGVTIRPFRPDTDEQAWLKVNARAFAHHPEQGGLVLDDLRQRTAEPWFDPAGFLLAERDGAVVGFHWTKQHPADLGEVYVLGTDPDARVRGLGRALLAAGLEHLRATGDTEVLLYVDGTNTRAVELYERAGFRIASRDVQYASRVHAAAALATMTAPSATVIAPDAAPATDSPQETA